jgi:hypothetical protein
LKIAPLDRSSIGIHNDGMIERLANVIYWAACVIAAVIAGGQITYPLNQLGETLGMIAMLCGPILCLGWAIRYILTGKKSIKP